MKSLFNLVFLALYGGLAVAATVYGPRWAPWLDQTWAVGLGAMLLFGGGLLHEIYARINRGRYLEEHMASLGYGYSTQQEELTWLGREVETLRDALDVANQANHAGTGGRTIEEVMSEVKVLKSLIPRLSADPNDAVISPGVNKIGPQSTLGGLVEMPRQEGAVQARLSPAAQPSAADKRKQAATLDIVRTALRNDRVDLVLQPIVSLPQRKRRFYECFSRLRTEDGGTILPERYIALAERAGLITAIDNMLLFRCVQLIRKIHRRNDVADFFCNISPHSLTDEEFFADFVEFLESNQELAPHLIFEFAQGDFARWSEVGARLLDRLSYLGCRFSIDQVTDLNFDVAALSARHVGYIKIEANLLLSEVTRNVGLLRTLQRHEIDLIAEKVEDENLLLELLDYDIDFGQGFLFGEPRLAKPAV